MTVPYWQPPGGVPPVPEQPPPKMRHRLRWVLLSVAGGLALIIGLALAFAPSTDHGNTRTATTPSAAPPSSTASPYTADEQTFISDARSQYNVGQEVADTDLVTVGKQVCEGVLNGDNRAALDKVPAQNGMSVSGGGADSLVNLALKDMCGGLEPKATWHTLGHYMGTVNGTGRPSRSSGTTQS